VDAASEIRVELARRGWNQREAARLIGISRPTLAHAYHADRAIEPEAAQAITEALFAARSNEERALLFRSLCTVGMTSNG
jgi:DNA-binding transcriptional regulator YdaS (Cro superfamily)